MHLVLDIGNSRVKAATFEGDVLRARARWQGHPWQEILSWAYNQKAAHIILSSVAEVPSTVREALQRHARFVELTHTTPLPFRNAYRTPETLGKDRLAAAAGAQHLFPGRHCVVVDAGTCLTCDLLTAEGVFLGGNISPGWRMRLEAMHAYTARLPRLEAAMPDSWYGRTTAEAMQAGAGYGMVWEVEGFVRQAERMLGPVQVVVTGGDADLFVRYWKTEIFANPDLVLIGLNQILKHNAEHAA